ncbi:hypothetical protein J6590_014126 [Homalodisca vitripennis]|nr:hypothetical protein J6590_014126 [Homalodisca vitripennis]
MADILILRPVFRPVFLDNFIRARILRGSGPGLTTHLFEGSVTGHDGPSRISFLELSKLEYGPADIIKRMFIYADGIASNTMGSRQQKAHLLLSYSQKLF